MARPNKSKKAEKVRDVPTLAAQPSPPVQLMDMVETFLSEHLFTTAHGEFRKQRAKNGWHLTTERPSSQSPSLVTLFQTWETSLNSPIASHSNSPKAAAKETATADSASEASADSDEEEDVQMDNSESSASSSSSSSSASSDDSEDDSDEDMKEPSNPIVVVTDNKLKRKALASDSDNSSSESNSSTSTSSSDSDDSGDDVPPAKKLKTAQESGSTTNSESNSSSDSDSDSDSGVEAASKVPLPASDSDASSSDSSSCSESEVEKTFKKPIISKSRKPDAPSFHAGSDSSVTLKTSPEFRPISTFPPLTPDPVAHKSDKKQGNGGNAKSQSEPFSRIAKGIKVEEKLAARYVPGDYDRNMYNTLATVKGNGFTKQKNKMKKGSYKAGFIDVGQKGGIKFED